MSLRTIHVCCRIVDNFGDAGVAWRLSRQLAVDHALDVTLWIDQPSVLERLVPGLATSPGPTLPAGRLRVRPWPVAQANESSGAPATAIALEAANVVKVDQDVGDADADVVIAAFGCDLPPGLRRRLAGDPARPLWINLEYLSAESWVDSCHGLSSLKADDGAREIFFFPGFRSTTGGLLREQGLLERRDRFRAGPQASQWWSSHGLPSDAGRRLSIFCYPEAPLAALLAHLARRTDPTLVLLCAGIGGQALEQLAISDRERPRGGATVADRWPTWRIGQLTAVQLPMLPIDDYDRLLWSCDLNFVRGEDSWIRAIWAGRPMVWQPYRQTQDTHLLKLESFQQWQAGQPAMQGSGTEAMQGRGTEAMQACWQLNRAWSTGQPLDDTLQATFAGLARLELLHEQLAGSLSGQSDLASRLVEYCRAKL